MQRLSLNNGAKNNGDRTNAKLIDSHQIKVTFLIVFLLSSWNQLVLVITTSSLVASLGFPKHFCYAFQLSWTSQELPQIAEQLNCHLMKRMVRMLSTQLA
jgi:hypothetical protein